MLRVLHVFDHSLPLYSGYTMRSRSILCEQRARGWETRQITGAKQGSGQMLSEEAEGLTFYRTPPGALSKLPILSQWDVVRGLQKRLTELIHEQRPDVIHAHSPALNGVAAVNAGEDAGVPVVYEIRAFWEDAAVDLGHSREGGLRYRMTRAMENWVLRRVDQTVCICEGIRGELLGRGFAPDRLKLVGNAVDAESFAFCPPRDEVLAAELGIGDGPVLGFIGSFYAYEGIPLLLDALPAIAERLPGVKLLLVGGGPQDELIREKAEAAELRDRVILTGRVPHAEVPRYASLIDAFVFPRHGMRLTDLTTPLKPLEAMAQGVLVVASDVGGHKELIRDGQTGFLFAEGDPEALANAVLRALSDPEQASRIRDNGRRYVEQERTWQVQVSRYEQVYDAARNHSGAS